MDSSKSLRQQENASFNFDSNKYGDRLLMEVPFYSSSSQKNEPITASAENCVMSVDNELIALGGVNDTIYIGRCSEMNKPWMEIKLLTKSSSCLQLKGHLLAQSKDDIVTIYDWHHHVRPVHQFCTSPVPPAHSTETEPLPVSSYHQQNVFPIFPTFTSPAKHGNLIQDLEWSYPISSSENAQNGGHLEPCGLWTCTPNCISHWDLRMNNVQTPSVRLDLCTVTEDKYRYFTSMARNPNQEEIGVLTSLSDNKKNAFQIFSTRYFHPKKPISSTTLDSAHSIASIGLLYHPLKNTYISWGYDNNIDNEIQSTVKFWKGTNNDESNNSVRHDYWYEGNYDGHNPNNLNPSKSLCIPNLYCVRLPPVSPVSSFEDDFIVTLSKDEKTKVKLWSLSAPNDEFDPILSFSMAASTKSGVKSNIIAAELATYHHSPSINSNVNSDVLVLCCFNSQGSFTVNGIPEASILKGNQESMRKVSVGSENNASKKEESDRFRKQTNKEQYRHDQKNINVFYSSSPLPARGYHKSEVHNSQKKAATLSNHFIGIQKSDKSNIHSFLEDRDTHHQHHPIFQMSNDLSSSTLHQSNPLDDSNHSYPYYKYPFENNIVVDPQHPSETTSNNTKNVVASRAPSSENFNSAQNVAENERSMTSENYIQKAMRVPCPPLCGASFGNDGNLIVFHNGNIRSMWTWFQSSNTTNTTLWSKTSYNNVLLENNQQETKEEGFESIYNRENNKNIDLSELVCQKDSSITKRNLTHSQTDKSVNQDKKKAPKTMYDLMQMNASAKIAQWGLDRDDISIEDEQDDMLSSSSRSDSDDSSSSSSDFDEDFFSSFSSKARITKCGHMRTSSQSSGKIKQNINRSEEDIYNYYFGTNFEKLIMKDNDISLHELNDSNTYTNITRNSNGPVNNDKEKQSSTKLANRISFNHESNNANENHTAVPMVSMLSPVVSVRRRYRSIILNDQCPHLARGWQLGSYVHQPLSQDDTDSFTKLSRNSSNRLSFRSLDSFRNSNNLDDEGEGKAGPTLSGTLFFIVILFRTTHNLIDTKIRIWKNCLPVYCNNWFDSFEWTHFVNTSVEIVSDSYFFPFLYKRFSFEASSNAYQCQDKLKNIKSSPNLLTQQQVNDYDMKDQGNQTSNSPRQSANVSRRDSMIGNIRKLFYQNQSGSFASVPLDQKVSKYIPDFEIFS